MRSTLLAPLLLAAALCALPAAQSSQPSQALRPPSAEEAFSGSNFAAPRLSPDGRHLALLVARRGRMGLSIFDLEKGEYESHLNFTDADIADPMWLGNGRLLYTLAQYGQSRKTQLAQGEPVRRQPRRPAAAQAARHLQRLGVQQPAPLHVDDAAAGGARQR